MNNMNTYELVSALADGQLAGEEFSAGLSAAVNDAAAREAWQAYHLIGDVLRSSDLAAGTETSVFMSRLSQRLASEAPPQVLVVAPQEAPLARSQADTAIRPANDPVFRWKVAAGLASIAAVAAVGWQLLAATPAVVPQGAQLASVPANAGLVMIRNPKLDELLAAHQQLGGAGALQMPASFVRQATFDPQGR